MIVPSDLFGNASFRFHNIISKYSDRKVTQGTALARLYAHGRPNGQAHTTRGGNFHEHVDYRLTVCHCSNNSAGPRSREMVTVDISYRLESQGNACIEL